MDDLISRQATLDAISTFGNREYRRKQGTLRDAYKLISALPSEHVGNSEQLDRTCAKCKFYTADGICVRWSRYGFREEDYCSRWEETMRAIEILERAEDENGNVPMSLVRKAFEKTEPHWIPCSERLPETEETVLVWLPSHWDKNGGTVEIGFLDENNEWNWLAESMNGYYEIVDYVSAWMPLPEGWKGEDDETTNKEML